jgi:hypothetical protein
MILFKLAMSVTLLLTSCFAADFQKIPKRGRNKGTKASRNSQEKTAGKTSEGRRAASHFGIFGDFGMQWRLSMGVSHMSLRIHH